MKTILINGNNITLTGLSELDVIVHIQRRHLATRQFSAVSEEDGTVSLTFPMSPLERGEFAGHIHRYNNEQRAKNTDLDPKGPGPNGTPPTGGTPGAARVTSFQNTVAIAA
jgi:hypothetical protein